MAQGYEDDFETFNQMEADDYRNEDEEFVDYTEAEAFVNDDYRDEGDIYEDLELLSDLFDDGLGNQEEWDTDER